VLTAFRKRDTDELIAALDTVTPGDTSQQASGADDERCALTMDAWR
jgi:hypothetical protein